MTPAGSPRLPYPDLPAPLRADVEAALGSPVVTVSGRTGGLSPGTAAVLTCADGTRAHLEAVGTPLDPDTPDPHRTEARVAAAPPQGLPAPRLRWWTERDVGGNVWVALLFDAVDGEPPADLDLWERRHLDRLAAVPDRSTASGGLSGATPVHLDARADNLLVTSDGTVFLVDWPWAARGAAWWTPCCSPRTPRCTGAWTRSRWLRTPPSWRQPIPRT